MFSNSTFPRLILGGFMLFNLAVVSAAENGRFISVTGSGQVSAAPDTAWITSGVVTQAPTAVEAVDKNNQLTKKVIETFLDADLEESAINTSGFNVHPVYDHSQPSGGGSESLQPLAYQVTNSVTVKLTELDELGELLDQVIKAGSNRISGIRFGFNDNEALLDQARALAIANAHKKAQLYAGEAGVEVGEVASISETGARIPQPVMHRMASAQAMEAVPVMAGEQEISVDITVVYFIED